MCGLYLLRFCGQIFKCHFYPFFQQVLKDFFWLFPIHFVLPLKCGGNEHREGNNTAFFCPQKMRFQKTKSRWLASAWLGLHWSCHKVRGDKLMSSDHVPGDSLLEISP